MFRELSIANNKLSQWGASVIQWWELQIEEEIKLLIKIKEAVNGFVELTNKLHIIAGDTLKRSNHWNQMDVV